MAANMQKNLVDKLPSALYVVATPIGNLEDITFRAIEILKQVDLILAEDTRHSHRLLQHFDIHKPLISYHDHNEPEKEKTLLQELAHGKSLALISDAGTPLISDPGYRLVRLAQDLGFKVIPIPGPCALIAALSVSGLATDQFIFSGFLPAKSSARIKVLESLKSDSRTQIFYEAPHRIIETLEDMSEVLGEEREIVIARELTKTFETIYRSSIKDVIGWIKTEKQERGEFVVLVAGFKKEGLSETHFDSTRVLKILLSELSLKQAVHLAAEITDQPKNVLYDMALKMK